MYKARIEFMAYEDWTKDDYREHEINGVQEVTREEYYIIKKYIY